MLVECGFTRATLATTGDEFTFTPSLARIAGLGDPFEIVRLYAALHGPNAAQAAADVLAGLCDQEDVAPLIGEQVPTVTGVRWQGGAMVDEERVILARHLMQHGICGKARPGSGGGGAYSDRFDAAEYVAAARAHLGMSSADAEALSMTEFQALMEAKFPPQAGDGRRSVPTREEYERGMQMLKERHGVK